MNGEEKVKLLSSLSSYKLDYTGVVLPFEFSDKIQSDKEKVKLSAANIDFESINDVLIEITLKDLNIPATVFIDKNHFLTSFKINHLKSDSFAILFYENSYLLYDNGKTEIGSEPDTTTYFIENAFAALELKNILISLADYNNSSILELVYYTSTKGVFKFRYDNKIPDLDSRVNYSAEAKNVSIKIVDKNFQLFFKNELADFSKLNYINKFEELIKNIPILTKEADKNVELYLKNFSWETFRSKLYLEKDKYFISLRDILGKIMTQLIAVPISISATIFATYKVNQPLISFLVGLAFTLYVIFVIHIQIMYYKDVSEIKSDFERDFLDISNKSGLPENIISIEKNKISRRILSITNLIVIFIALIVVLGSFFNLFLLAQYSTSIITKLFIFFFLFIYAAIRVYSALKH